jgi:hypothetical protein
LSIAILCEVESYDVTVEDLIIFPSCHNASNCSPPLRGTFLSMFPYEDLTSHKLSSSFLKQLNSFSVTSATRAVCTVQTFQNQLTGPALYLFVRYYLELDWIVIVFDRFGDHSSHISSFLSSQRFFYFPMTILTQLLPDLYNDFYRSQQVPPPSPLTTPLISLVVW